MDHEYRSLLLNIARQITTRELGEISFLCSGRMIPERRREEITETLQLFRELENQNRLGIDKLDWLIYMLDNIHRQDLILKLRDFQVQRNVFLSRLQRGANVTDSGFRERNVTNLGEERTFHTSSEIYGSAASRISQSSSNNRDGGEMTLRCALRLASVGAWCAGCVYILHKYKDNPETLMNMMSIFVLPSGIVLQSFNSGSINLVLRATDLNALKQLWNRYKTGQLRDDLEKLLVTEGLKNLANDEMIDFSVEMSEYEYRNACLDLMVAHCEATRYINTGLSRPPRRSRSLPDMTSLHMQSFTGRDQTQESSRDQLSDNLMRDSRSSLSVIISGEPLEANASYLRDFLSSSDRLPNVCVLLDRDMALSHDWRSLASEFGYKMTDIYRMERKASPSLALLEDIAFKTPDTRTSKLIEKLASLKRDDAVDCITSKGRTYDDEPKAIRNLPFHVRKQIAVELDNATQAQFSDVARGIIKQIRPSQIVSLRRRPSPTMALLEELDTMVPSQPVSTLLSACIKVKVRTVVTILQNYIESFPKPRKLDRLRLPIRRSLCELGESQDSGIDGDEPLSP